MNDVKTSLPVLFELLIHNMLHITMEFSTGKEKVSIAVYLRVHKVATNEHWRKV